MRVHTFTIGVKLAAQVVQDGLFSSFVPIAGYLAVEKKLVEDTAVRRAQVLIVGHAFGTHVVLRLRRVDEVPRHIQVSSQDHILAHLRKIPDSCVKRSDEAIPKVIAQAVAVRWTVDAEKNEGRELDDETSSFRIESVRIYSKTSDLYGRGVATYARMFWEFTVGR